MGERRPGRHGRRRRGPALRSSGGPPYRRVQRGTAGAAAGGSVASGGRARPADRGFGLRRPCAHCPFTHTTPGYLRPARAEELSTAVLTAPTLFPCHITIHYPEPDGPPELRSAAGPQWCVGALLFARQLAGTTAHHANALVQIAERLGWWDPDDVPSADQARVFASQAAMVAHHAGASEPISAQGDDAALVRALQEALQGPDHPATAWRLNELATQLYTTHDYAAARPLFERALAIREATLGPHHPETAWSLNNLAALLDTVGETAAARPLLERALAILAATLGPHHPDTEAIRTTLQHLGETPRS